MEGEEGWRDGGMRWWVGEGRGMRCGDVGVMGMAWRGAAWRDAALRCVAWGGVAWRGVT